MGEVPTTDKFGFPAVPCSRCMGQGGMERYNHVDAGVCFQCQGAKVVVVDPKAKAAKAAFLAARVQLTTVAALTEGDTFTTGGHNVVTQWCKLLGTEKVNQGIALKTTRGTVVVPNAEFPVRLYVPTDVTEYLKGL
jgi:hypothetical protein